MSETYFMRPPGWEWSEEDEGGGIHVSGGCVVRPDGLTGAEAIPQLEAALAVAHENREPVYSGERLGGMLAWSRWRPGWVWHR